MFRLARHEAETVEIFIKVNAGALEDSIGRVERQPDGSLKLLVNVRVAPENGADNAAVIKLISKQFGVSKSCLRLAQGEAENFKTVIAPDSSDLRAQLEALI